jgi:hypothetical protein
MCCVDFFERDIYNDDGTLAEADDYDEAGPDGLWGTADDVQEDAFVYAYDEVGRLVSVKEYPGGDKNAAPDWQQTSVYGANDRIESITTIRLGSATPSVQTFRYDARGNAISWVSSDPFDGTWTSRTTYDDNDNVIRMEESTTGELQVLDFDTAR